MLHCPFCNTELDTDSVRVRGGRCPSCGSILNWADPKQTPPAGKPATRVDAPAPDLSDDDNLSMRDIVRTLVQRGSQGYDDGPAFPPASSAAPADVRKTPPNFPASPTPPAVPPTAALPPSASLPGVQPGAIDNLWKGTLTTKVTPLMTLKAASAAPDPAVSDLLIRPHRIRYPDERELQGAEYELQETIGEGGVGVVYAARQASVDRTVALKMLKQEFAHETDHRQKFLSEAVVTGELDHPNIVPIYDLGTSDYGALFYAMKRVRGTPWSEVIRQKSLADNLRIFLSVADAIAFAHARGVIHRDLKPENVMLGDYGEVLVMDWGIALSTATYVKSGRISQSTSMGGTPAYMAPEMATGPLDKIGPASDVYLLGAILYEIVTGQPPHTGKDVMSCLYAAARNEIVPTDKSGELLDIARQAMATRPADRHASVQALQAAVRTYQSHSESIVLSERATVELATAQKSRDYQDYSRALFAFQEARGLWAQNQQAQVGEEQARLAYAKCALEKGDFDLGVSLLDERQPRQAPLRRELVSAQRERDARQSRLRNLRNLAAGLAATIFLVVTGGLVVIWRTNQELRQTTTDLIESEGKLRKNEKTLRKNADDLAQGNRDLAAQKRVADRARNQAIEQARQAELAQQRALAASYLAQIGVGAERVSNNSFVDARDLLRRYNEEYTYFRNWEWGHLTYLCNLSRAEQTVGGRIECLAGNSDGSLIAAGTNAGEIHLWRVDWEAVKFEPLATLHAGSSLAAIAMAGDGSWIASAADGDRGEIQIWRRTADEGEAFQKGPKLTGHKDHVVSLSASASGRQLASGSLDESARLWNVERGEPIESYFGHFGPVWSVACSGAEPVPAAIVTGGDDGTVRVWTVGRPNQARCIYRGHSGPVFAVAASPSGMQVASAGRDKTVQVWEPAKVRPFDFDQLGSRIRTAGLSPSSPLGTLPRQLPVPEHRLLVGHDAEVRAVEFSRDGTHVLSAGNDNTVRLWNFHEPTAPDYQQTFRGHGGWVRGCLLAGQGRYAVSGSHDGQVKVWDREAYEEVGALRGHADAVLWAAFSRSGDRMVTAGRDRQALLWNLHEREPIKALTDEPPAAGRPEPVVQLQEGHEFLVTAAAQFPAGDHRLLTSAGDNSVRMWDMQLGGQIRRFDGTGTISVVALSDDGQWIVTGSQDKSALLWSADDPQAPPMRLEGHAAEVSAAAIWAAEGDLAGLQITTGDVAGGLRQWRFDAQRQSFVSTELRGHEPGYAIVAVRYTPGGQRLLTASQDHSVQQWNPVTGQKLPDAILRHPRSVRALDVSPDGRQALTLCEIDKEQFRIFLWDLERAAAQTCDVALPKQSLTSVSFAHDGKSAIVVSSADETSELWKWQFDTTPTVEPLWKNHIIRALVWAAFPTRDGGGILAVGGSQARLFNSQTGVQERTFSPHGAVTSANFSPRGDLVVTSSVDGDVKLWITDPQDPRYGKVALKIVGAHSTGSDRYGVSSAAFSPIDIDGRPLLVTAGDDGTARLFRIEADRAIPIQILAGHKQRVRSAVFGPDGNWVLTASDDGEARLWNAQQTDGADATFVVLHHPAAVLFADFSLDGKRAITGCDDNNARLWDCSDPAAPRLLYVLEGHTAGVTSAAISPDGRRALTGSQDGMAKLWDLEKQGEDDDEEKKGEAASQPREILSLKRHSAEVTSTHFSPDGRSILTSSHDTTALLWLSVDIGPSLKLSRSTITAAEGAKSEVFDPDAEIRDPDSSQLDRARLTIEITSPSPGASLQVLPDRGFRVSETSVLRMAGEAEQLIATIERGSDSASQLVLVFREHCTLTDAQEVLRSIGWASNAPLATELAVRFELQSGSTGSASTAAIKIVPPAQKDAASASSNETPN